ncbi:protein FAM151B isoform X2 [Ischnura elegans]|uniref:protein FAM151B isoform X2 n=1 Tax=Ischnura elegans TaxID=197161 RepID=UPI001ED8952F|nr:protein FAM151B isoform X2 [Ischnura elegans]
MEMSQAQADIPAVPDFFPQIHGDLTKVTWAHAVNSMALLMEALEGNVMMLEADVVLGTLVDSPEDILPIMGHPPANTSDISLEQFLDHIVEKRSKGIKLDFKTTEAFKASLPVLGKFKDKMTFPVWLNADILQGPVESEKTPVDADAFLYACRTIFPQVTLSVGWTTLYGSDADYVPPKNSPPAYSQRHVLDMLDALRMNSVSQPVTFPVRAGLAANSPDPMIELIGSESNGNTLTIWSAKDDPVNVPALKSLMDRIGRKRIYVDVPEPLERQLTGGVGSIFHPAPLALGLIFASLSLLLKLR